MTDYDMGRCDCGYRERKTMWDAEPYDEKTARRKAEDPHGHGMIGWAEARAWHAPTCAALSDYPLAEFGVEMCPKCRSDVTPTWHEAKWYVKPHRHDYWRGDLDTWDCLLTYQFRPVEHVERRCRCGWVWVEKPADA